MGLLPVGGKIHVLHPVNAKRFAAFRNIMGLNNTPFKLIHANDSVNLPAVPSGKELALIVGALENFGLLDSEYPELQISIPGRLTKEGAAVLGSAILLATEKGVLYDEHSFVSEWADTKANKIMAYDANGPRVNMPFMTPLKGRTDMLGRRSLGDIELYQIIGTVLAQEQAGSGPFKDLAQEFKERYREILDNYGIAWVLEKDWIFDPKDAEVSETEAKDHYTTVKACTDLYFGCAAKLKETGLETGIIFAVRDLIDWLQQEVSRIQDLNYDPEIPCDEMRILLEF